RSWPDADLACRSLPVLDCGLRVGVPGPSSARNRVPVRASVIRVRAVAGWRQISTAFLSSACGLPDDYRGGALLRLAPLLGRYRDCGRLRETHCGAIGIPARGAGARGNAAFPGDDICELFALRDVGLTNSSRHAKIDAALEPGPRGLLS